MKIITWFALSLSILVFNSYAEDGSDHLGREKVETICSVCHGMDGQAGSAGNSALIPNLTAQNKLYLIEKLNAYKSGKLEHHQMGIIAQMLSKEDIENISDWYSSIEIIVKSKFEQY